MALVHHVDERVRITGRGVDDTPTDEAAPLP
jgi:hypothetical protein